VTVVTYKHKNVGRTRVAIAVAAVLVVPALLNTLTNEVLRTRHPVPGAFYLINGRPMHLYCSGHGTPIVVLDAGGEGMIGYWQKVQPELEKTQRVCSYDRAGVGWSELQPGVRDARNISMELHPERLGFAATTGRVANGQDADLVMLDGDPARDLMAFSRVKMTLR